MQGFCKLGDFCRPLMNFSGERKDFCQRCMRFLAVKCPSDKIFQETCYFSQENLKHYLSVFHLDSHWAYHVNIQGSLRNLRFQIISIFRKLQKDHALLSWVHPRSFIHDFRVRLSSAVLTSQLQFVLAMS